MSDFAQQLKNMRVAHKLSQKTLAQDLNMAVSSISMYENGSREPSLEVLQKIARYFDVSVDYMMGSSDKPTETMVDSAYDFDNIFPIRTQKIPFLGEISCGKPILASEEQECYVLAGTNIHADYCLRAKGDSMTGARIFNGDIVFIRKQPMVDNGEIAAVIIDDEATLKRVYYYPEKGKLVLQAENPAYEPLVYVGEELNEIRILGKAISFQSDVK